MPDVLILILVCVLMVALMLIGVPIAFSLGITGMLGIILLKGWNMFFGIVLPIPYSHVNSWLLVALPLFVLMGSYADKGGIADKAYDNLYRMLGGLKGGLAMATIASCAAFAAITGSSAATAVAIGKVSLPQMLRRGYDKRFSTGTIASGSFLGILIPPSAILVIYGLTTNTSIGKLFIAGIVPGVLIGLFFILGAWLQVLIRPSLAPVASEYVSMKDKAISLFGLWEIFLLFLIVMAGLYTGIATATEAAAIGAFAALILLIGHKKRNAIPAIITGMKEATGIVCMIITITMLGSFFSKFLLLSGIGKIVAGSISSMSVKPTLVMLAILATYLPLGMFLDGISMIVITTPIYLPLIMPLGYDPIWFGIMITAMVEISLITPPLGLNLFIVKAISPTDVSIGDIFIGTLPYLLLELILVVLMLIFPEIVMWLPKTMMN